MHEGLYRHDMASMSSRSDPAAHPDSSIVATQPTYAKQSWWELLSSISSPTATSGHQARDAMVQLLSEAESIVKVDSSWRSSGVQQLLQRALVLAQKGQLLGAQRMALNAVDFATAYTRISDQNNISSVGYEAAAGVRSPAGVNEGRSLKCSVAKAHQPAGAGGSISFTSSDVTSSGITPAAPSTTNNPHPQTAVATDCGTCSAAAQEQDFHDSRPTEVQKQQISTGDMPPPPSKRQKLLSDTNNHTGLASADVCVMPLLRAPVKQQRSGSPDCLQEWCGQLSLAGEDGGRVSDLCNVTLQLPSSIAGYMPPMLKFTHLVQRRGVTLGVHQAVRATINKANTRQLSRLRSMAQHELVAVQALSERSHVIFVPYTDKQAQLKAVCFYLQG